MPALECNIQVNWRHRVLFTDRVFDARNRMLRDVLAGNETEGQPKVLVVLDQSLASEQSGLVLDIATYFDAHTDAGKLVRPPLIIEGGETVKNSDRAVTLLHAEIERHHIDRQSFLLCVGGGALLDVAGFAAATAHRGVRHVRLPTTTLSQCDSGVGVKNGINAFGKKNFVGTFSPPFAVINDFAFLATLPLRHKRAGYVEAVKVACIRDARFFEELEREAPLLSACEPQAMRRLIHRCARLHVEHIASGGDPFEMGSRRPLDFGHWAAHKLEQLSNFQITHGEAVAIGIALDVIYSRRSKFLNPPSAERVLQLLQTLGFRLFADELLHSAPLESLSVLKGLDEFREHLGGRLCVTLLRDIGSGFEAHEMSNSRVVESVHELRERVASHRPAAALDSA